MLFGLTIEEFERNTLVHDFYVIFMKMIPGIVDVITVLRLITTELPVSLISISLTVLPDVARNILRFAKPDLEARVDDRMVTCTNWREVSNISIKPWSLL